MPASGQIVPAYLHPHVATYIYDNTQVTETKHVEAASPTVICVFTSGKGRDGVLLNKKSIKEFTDEYGYPNYRVDGQPIYNAINVLNSGVAQVTAMRVMPEDAGYANIVVVAKIKANDTNDGLVIRHEAKCHTSITNTIDLETLTDAMRDTTPDADGFITIPLFAFRSLGRGTYGNAFSVRISGIPQSDKENGFKTYRFEVFETSNGLKKLEIFEGSLYVDAVSSLGTAYAPDIFNDTTNGSQRVAMYASPTALDEIFDYYTQAVPDTELVDYMFDVLMGTDINGAPIPNLTIETENSPFLATEGLRLSYGSDGSFATSNIVKNATSREEAIAEAYCKAFRGELDRSIISKRRRPTLFFLDANYPEEVKLELVNLVNRRGDRRLYLDCGILTTTSEAVAYGKRIKNIADMKISKDFHHYRTRDQFTNRAITVTMTYFLASELTRHVCTVGAHIPFTGEHYAKLTGHIPNSLCPIVDVDDLELKEQLYELRMNYFESIAENTYVRATQSTSQNIWSDLSEESNVLLLKEMQYLLEDLTYSLTYNFASAEDRARYTEDATRLLEPFKNGKVSNLEVFFDMTAWEEERSILHCYLAITYRGIAKRGIIEIDVNKRV